MEEAHSRDIKNMQNITQTYDTTTETTAVFRGHPVFTDWML